MPSDKRVRRLQDMIDNAHAIVRYTAGMDLGAFQRDRRRGLLRMAHVFIERTCQSHLTDMN